MAPVLGATPAELAIIPSQAYRRQCSSIHSESQLVNLL